MCVTLLQFYITSKSSNSLQKDHLRFPAGKLLLQSSDRLAEICQFTLGNLPIHPQDGRFQIK